MEFSAPLVGFCCCILIVLVLVGMMRFGFKEQDFDEVIAEHKQLLLQSSTRKGKGDKSKKKPKQKKAGSESTDSSSNTGGGAGGEVHVATGSAGASSLAASTGSLNGATSAAKSSGTPPAPAAKGAVAMTYATCPAPAAPASTATNSTPAQATKTGQRQGKPTPAQPPSSLQAAPSTPPSISVKDNSSSNSKNGDTAVVTAAVSATADGHHATGNRENQNVARKSQADVKAAKPEPPSAKAAAEATNRSSAPSTQPAASTPASLAALPTSLQALPSLSAAVSSQPPTSAATPVVQLQIEVEAPLDAAKAVVLTTAPAARQPIGVEAPLVASKAIVTAALPALTNGLHSEPEAKKAKSKGKRPSTDVTGLLTAIDEAALSRSEVQQLVETLLARQDESAWTSTSKQQKTDPIASLKKQLEDKDLQLAEERQQAVGAATRARQELLEERTKATQRDRKSQDRISALQQEVTALTSRMQQTHEQHSRDLIALAQHQGDAARIVQLTKEIEQLKALLAQAQGGDNAAIAAAKDEMLRMQAERDKSAQKLSSVESAHSALEQRCRTLDEQLSAKRDNELAAAKRLEELSRELQSSEQLRRDEALTAVASAKAGATEMARLSGQAEEAERHVLELLGKVANAESAVRQAEDILKERDVEVQSLRNQSNLLDNELKARELESTQRQQSTSDSDALIKEREAAEAVAAAAAHAAEQAKLLSEQTANAAQLGAELDEALRRLQQAMDEKNQHVADGAARERLTAEQLSAADQRLSEATGRESAALADLQSARTKIIELEDDLQRMQQCESDRHAMAVAERQRQVDIERLQQELELKSTEMGNLSSELSVQRQLSEDLQKAVQLKSKDQEENSQAASDLAAVQAKLHDLDTQLVSARSEAEVLHEEKLRLAEATASAQKQTEKAHAQWTQIKDALLRLYPSVTGDGSSISENVDELERFVENQVEARDRASEMAAAAGKAAVEQYKSLLRETEHQLQDLQTKAESAELSWKQALEVHSAELVSTRAELEKLSGSHKRAPAQKDVVSLKVQLNGHSHELSTDGENAGLLPNDVGSETLCSELKSMNQKNTELSETISKLAAAAQDAEKRACTSEAASKNFLATRAVLARLLPHVNLDSDLADDVWLSSLEEQLQKALAKTLSSADSLGAATSTEEISITNCSTSSLTLDEPASPEKRQLIEQLRSRLDASEQQLKEERTKSRMLAQQVAASLPASGAPEGGETAV